MNRKSFFLGSIFLAAIAAFLLVGFLYGRTYADINVYVFGVPQEVLERNELQLSFLDKNEKELAVGHFAKRGGYFYVDHSRATGCPSDAMANNPGSFTKDEWHRCYQRASAWIAEWVRKAEIVTIVYRNCPPTIEPFTFRRYGDWLLWWVPLPHVGGLSPALYSMALRAEPEQCFFTIER